MPEVLQNSTQSLTSTPVDKPEIVEQQISPLQDDFITFSACDGLMVEAGGDLQQLSMEQYAQRIGVHRTTLYNWQKSIPDFKLRVTRRTAEIFTGSRRNKIYNGLFLRAARGDAEQAKILLSHFPDADQQTWQPPAQRHDVKVSGGVVDLLNAARERERELESQKPKVIEAEVVDGRPADD